MSKKSIALILLFVGVGILYRLYIASFFPHQPIGDEYVYFDIVKSMFNNFWTGHSCSACAKAYGYPFFLYVLMRLTNWNLSSIIFTQAVLDSLTAILIFLISLHVFKKSKYAYISYFLYLFNPLTASWTGFFLTEILAMFLITLSLYIYLLKENILNVLLFGLFMGYLGFVRPLFILWIIGFLSFYGVYLILKQKQLFKVLFLLIGFGLTTINPLVTNWNLYRKIAFTPSPPLLGMALFSLKVENWPQTHMDPSLLDKEREYLPAEGETNETFLQRKLLPEFNTAIKKVLLNPISFIMSRIRINIYLWNKSNLYYFSDPFDNFDRPLLIGGNIIFLLLSLVGVLKTTFSKVKKTFEIKVLVFFFTVLFYSTLTLSFKVAEERLTLPFYPILIVFLPIGAASIYRLLFISKTKLT